MYFNNFLSHFILVDDENTQRMKKKVRRGDNEIIKMLTMMMIAKNCSSQSLTMMIQRRLHARNRHER